MAIGELRLEVGEATLYAARYGAQGEAVILLHGLGETGATWDEVVPRLSESLRVIVPDLRGCGASTHDDVPYTLDRAARDVLAVARAAGAPRFCVVGHSLGGVIAQELLTRHGDHVDAAVLVSTSSRVGRRATDMWLRVAAIVEARGVATSFDAHARAFSDDFATRRPDVVDVHARRAASCDAGIYTAQARAAAAYDYSEALEDVRQPVLVLQGLADRLTSPGGSVLLERDLPNASLEMMDGVGHNLHVEEPERFVTLVTDFLERSRQWGANPRR